MSGAGDPGLQAPRVIPRAAIRLSWSDPKLRDLVWQVLIVGGVLLVVAYLAANTVRNLNARHIATGFGYLSRVAGIPVGESLIPYDAAENTYAYVLLIGVLNTLRVAIAGIVLATLLGIAVGVARLSANWLLARLAAIYVEVLRDIPVLLQLLFWYALLQTLPGPRQALHPFPGTILSNRGIRLPWFLWQPGYGWVLLSLLAGVVATVAWSRRAGIRQAATGIRPPVLGPALAAILGLPLLVWLATGARFVPDIPALHGFNFQGGVSVSPEYGALLAGLVLYTSAFIAEIVRSGILAVSAGQWEAANALGLTRGRSLRLIVLPQALRVIIPPLTSEYLNLTKNTSLAIAIGYQDIVSIANTELNQTGQAIEGVAVIMAVYLSISLSISFFMNWYNARLALVER